MICPSLYGILIMYLLQCSVTWDSYQSSYYIWDLSLIMFLKFSISENVKAGSRFAHVTKSSVPRWLWFGSVSKSTQYLNLFSHLAMRRQDQKYLAHANLVFSLLWHIVVVLLFTINILLPDWEKLGKVLLKVAKSVKLLISNKTWLHHSTKY